MIDLVGEYCAAMRRMPLSAAQELHNRFGVPWRAITLACPVPTRARFTDKARSLFEPDEDGGAVWVIPATCVDPARPEEIEVAEPLDVVSTGACVDLLAFDPDRPRRFARRTALAPTLGCIPRQHGDPAPVPVRLDVTDWLRAECHGLVILTRDPHEIGRLLRRIAAIQPEDPAHAAALKAWLGLPSYAGLPPRPVFVMNDFTHPWGEPDEPVAVPVAPVKRNGKHDDGG
jgi:hypothetical protein